MRGAVGVESRRRRASICGAEEVLGILGASTRFPPLTLRIGHQQSEKKGRKKRMYSDSKDKGVLVRRNGGRDRGGVIEARGSK